MYVAFDDLVQAARSGQLISFPTDTVPALAARPDQAAKIFEAKQRSFDKPLILMAATPDDLWPYVSGIDEERAVWQKVAEQYWPGALTLVLPASEQLPEGINPTGTQTVGIRIPNSAIARHILSQTGVLATTSVNKSGQPPLLTAKDIDAFFPQVNVMPDDLCAQLMAELEGSQSTDQGGVPSTVVLWQAEDWKILRQGGVEFGG